ncbi:MAG: tetratricopeptide repeat protein [Proteobacteria bacterium]|nr:tetratricopeptide repeat protein [Pseudomonadota bacterium]
MKQISNNLPQVSESEDKRVSEVFEEGLVALIAHIKTVKSINQLPSKKIFISYAWEEDDTHSRWVTNLAKDLKKAGLEILFDKYDGVPGEDLTSLIEKSIKDAAFILVIGTKEYLKKCEQREEVKDSRAPVVSAEMRMIGYLVDRSSVDNLKIIPILLEGNIDEALPLRLCPKLYVDFTEPVEYAKRLFDLVGYIYGLEKNDVGIKKILEERGLLPKKVINQEASLLRYRKVLHNLKERNLEFTGRKESLDKLGATLNSTNKKCSIRPQAVTGLGGAGKSQLAKEYAYREIERGAYRLVWWMRAGDSDSLNSEFLALANELKINIDLKPEERKNMVLEKLKEEGNWLLIFDDAIDSESLKPYYPLNSEGQVLITSRNVNAWEGQQITLRVFSREESKEYIFRWMRKAEEPAPHPISGFLDKEMNALAELLGDLPLALAQAVAYIRETGESIEEYIKLFKTGREALWLSEEVAKNYDTTIAMTWGISFRKAGEDLQKIQKKAKLALLVFFDYISYLYNEDIADIILKEIIIDKLILNNLKKILSRYALIKLDANQQSISLHVLVQLVIRDRVVYPKEMIESVSQILFDLLNMTHQKGPTQEVVIQWKNLLPQCESVINAAEEIKFEFSILASLCNSMGMAYSDLAEYPKALKYYEKSLKIRQKTLGETHSDVASSYNNIGVVYSKQSKDNKALEMHEKALTIWGKNRGLENSDVALSYNNLGAVYAGKGWHNKALEMHQKALTIWEKIYGVEHYRVALSYSNIGAVYLALGQYTYAKALEMHQKALKIREKIYGLEHSDVADSYSSIGGIYTWQGLHDKALEMYQKALFIREKIYGLKHPKVASSYNSIAYAHMKQGKYELSSEFSQKAVTIWEKMHDTHHSDMADVAVGYNTIGTIYSEQGQYIKALEMHEKALAILEKVHGLEHPSVAGTYNTLGLVYVKQGRYAKGLAASEKALIILEKTNGPKHANVAFTYNIIGFFYFRLDRYTEGLAAHEKALAIWKETYPDDHMTVRLSYHNIVLAYQGMGQHELALEAWEKTGFTRERRDSLDQEFIAIHYNRVGFVYIMQGCYEEALKTCEKARVILEKLHGVEHHKLVEIYHNLAKIYAEQGSYEAGLAMCKKALVILEKTYDAEHPDAARIYNIIGQIDTAQGQYQTALNKCEQAKVILEKTHGAEHPDLAQSYHNMAQIYMKQERYSGALDMYQRVLLIRKKIYGLEHSEVAFSYVSISMVYKTQKQYKAALETLEKAYSICSRTLPENHIKLKEIKVDLVYLRDKWAIQQMTQSLQPPGSLFSFFSLRLQIQNEDPSIVDNKLISHEFA